MSNDIVVKKRLKFSYSWGLDGLKNDYEPIRNWYECDMN